MSCTIEFPSEWIDASGLEKILWVNNGPHETATPDVYFRFLPGCKIMLDAIVRLLSLLNQLDHCCRQVYLDFKEGEAGVMGYLNRIGFFDHLSQRINIRPFRPSCSGAEIYGGMNSGLVEIAQINRHSRDHSLLTRLIETLMRACGNRSDAQELEGAAWTIFAELIDNVFSHSQTELAGYAALQVYPRGNKLKVAVSDSGLGIIETLRPALQVESSIFSRLSDLDLLVEVFRQGISRHGADRGCGLKGSAAKAMKYNAQLDVRLPKIRVQLIPGIGGYRPSKACCYDHLPLIWGTHICFTFQLDVT